MNQLLRFFKLLSLQVCLDQLYFRENIRVMLSIEGLAAFYYLLRHVLGR